VDLVFAWLTRVLPPGQADDVARHPALGASPADRAEDPERGRHTAQADGRRVHGGDNTIIGIPPNVLLASYPGEGLGIEITIAGWIMVGVPLVLVLLPLAWLFLTQVFFAFDDVRIRGGRQLIDDQLAGLGPTDRGEAATLAVFVGAAQTWLTRSWLTELTVFGYTPLSGLTESGVAILAASPWPRCATPAYS